MGSRILVIDDHDDLAQLLGEWLTSGGHEVRVVKRAADALPAAQELRPNVALIDVTLPDGDGMDVGRQLRRLDERIVLLATSGRTDDRTRRALEAAGFNAFLPKPVELDDLQRFIMNLAVRPESNEPAS